MFGNGLYAVEWVLYQPKHSFKEVTCVYFSHV